MLFAIGFVAMFVIGGLSGVTHAVVPSDYQQTDTYYIVAHFHYVLFGGAIFGLFGGHVLLVAEGVRAHAERDAGQGALLADADRVQHDVRPDAHPRACRACRARIQTYPASLGLGVLEPGLDDRRVRDRDQRARVPGQRGHELPQAQADARPTRGTRGRSSGRRPRRRPSTTSTRSRSCTRSTSCGTASTPRPRAGASCRCRPGGSGRPRHAGGTAASHAIHMPSPSYFPLVAAARASDRSATALIFGWWLGRRGRRRDRARRVLRVGPRALGGVGAADGDLAHAIARLRERARGHQHRAAEHEARDVAVPRLGLPAVRRADHDLRAVPGRERRSGRTRSDVFDIPYTSVSSFVLLASSLTMVLALAAIQRGDVGRMRLWLLATAMLGMTFVGGQVYEFTTFFREGLTLTTNLFGTTFFVLTGFHGTHVAIGILMLLTLFALSFGGQITQDRRADRRARRAVLALRGHRVDRDLHGRVPDPDEPGRREARVEHGRRRRHRRPRRPDGHAPRARRPAPEPEGVHPDRGHPRRSITAAEVAVYYIDGSTRAS